MALRVLAGPHQCRDRNTGNRPDTFNEEYMPRSILLYPIREVLDNPVHIVTGRHEQVYCLKSGLGLAIIRD